MQTETSMPPARAEALVRGLLLVALAAGVAWALPGGGG